MDACDLSFPSKRDDEALIACHDTACLMMREALADIIRADITLTLAYSALAESL